MSYSFSLLSSPHFLFFLVLGLILTGIFWFFPEIDIATSSLFYSSEKGFYHYGEAAFQFFRYLLNPAIAIYLVILLVVWRFGLITSSAFYYLVSSLAIGPGLIVNALLKNYWGRPRPHQTDLFGGSFEYSRVWEISDACLRNCSFVSGDVSVGFYLIVFPLLWGKKYPALYLLPFIVGGYIGVARIAVGAHYLSDTLLSAWIVCFSSYLLHRAFFRETNRSE